MTSRTPGPPPTSPTSRPTAQWLRGHWPTPRRGGTWGRSARAWCEGAGFHDLRRANATALVRDGVDIKTAQALLRHGDSRLTLNLYAEAETEAEVQATDRMGSRFLSWRRSTR